MSINKLALLSAFAAALLAPKAAFTMDMYESMLNDVEANIDVEKTEKRNQLIKKIECLNKEMEKTCKDFKKLTELENSIVFFKSLELTKENSMEKSAKTAKSATTDMTIEDIEKKIQFCQYLQIECKKKFDALSMLKKIEIDASKDEVQYLKFIEIVFREYGEAKDNKDNKELESQYWENFNLIRKEQSDSNHRDIKHFLTCNKN